MTLRIVAYSDYVCPWCYIGLQRVERLEREFPVAVEWRPFELHPETPRTGANLAGRLGGSARAAAYRDNIVGLARESGLALRMPSVVANSHLALEAAEFAREQGGFAAYHRELFHAYFEDARDLGDFLRRVAPPRESLQFDPVGLWHCDPSARPHAEQSAIN